MAAVMLPAQESERERAPGAVAHWHVSRDVRNGHRILRALAESTCTVLHPVWPSVESCGRSPQR
eukprot:2653880-Rhodomonas_salina.2